MPLNDKIDQLETKLADSNTNFSNQIDALEMNGAESDSESDDEIQDMIKQPLDLLVISDSICKHLKLDLINPGRENKLICRPGAKIAEVRQALVSIQSQYQINKLVIHLMTNNIPNEAPEDIARQMVDFIDEIKSNMPETKLFISSVLPKCHWTWLEGINCLNKIIWDACISRNVYVIQHLNFANRGRIIIDLFCDDKLHLSHLGVKQMGMDIKNYLRGYRAN